MARATLRGYFENNLSLEDVQALAPDILAAVKTPSPADKMFSNEIRMGGFKALAKYNFKESIEAGVEFARTQGGHGSESRTGEIMREIMKFGTAARGVLPQLQGAGRTLQHRSQEQRVPRGLQQAAGGFGRTGDQVDRGRDHAAGVAEHQKVAAYFDVRKNQMNTKAIRVVMPVLLATSWVRAADLSKVPQIHETQEQRDERMQWFRDAKFGMFIHWGPCSVGQKEIGWGRDANRPWDINGVQTPRTEDPVYDNYYKQFNPTKYDADAWVKFAKASGMKYMVLIAKHHDGFAQFDSKAGDYNIMASPYKKDIVKAYADACHKHGMKLGLYYSTRDWHHPDYLVGDNKKYDEFYRAQVKELLGNYGQVDVMWFDHVGGRDWGKWKFDELFEMMYQPPTQAHRQ